ncbi:ABC transporter ATP-binding protein [Mucilaginibacter sp. E4BP6]|uniref:ABC transporter ATP-binding protein n=1 Tax=Mucilaginibacter sp. E4BP6 TaxID=2723089 RepID=UPI00180F0EC8|nr:ABC transporter ATP-binding protein [Mucilaginibacter sp. E4BP6]NYE67577.1 ABC-type polysaccharide/polyol phosphate transport system ATPase subunit [Mucilaginibacter sp. E4BP6]
MAKAIKVEGLSKAYQLGDFGTGTISRDVERFIARMRGKEDPYLRIGEPNDRTAKGESNIVWCLKDLNFDIEQGDAVGIIGRNGAGKSTLLKILSRITSPTTGSIKIKGRIASLLEVGTGFSPELTGRENIYLNGAILGMRKSEIKRRFDEIVDFSGVERYIDTPVKRYSSGMYVRLAFAVAAHLESEILIVDEVLAVGDAEFQKKCLGKMGDISKGEGRTVLFVSHNMASITALCNTGLYLESGKLKRFGEIEAITQLYYDSQLNKADHDIDVKVNFDHPSNQWVYKSFLNLSISWLKNRFINGCYCDISFHTNEGIKLFSLQSHKFTAGEKINSEFNSVVFKIENVGLVSQDLRVDIGFRNELSNQYILLIENACQVSVPKNDHNNYSDVKNIILPNASIEITNNHGL